MPYCTPECIVYKGLSDFPDPKRLRRANQVILFLGDWKKEILFECSLPPQHS